MRYLLSALALFALLAAASPGTANSLLHCEYHDGGSEAEADGDLAICGPCLGNSHFPPRPDVGGVCATAIDLVSP